MYVEELKNNREWETFLQVSQEGTFYHSIKWKEVIQKSFPHYALYLTIKDENNRIVGICPGFIQNSMCMNFFYSIPYSDYGGPVITKHCMRQASLSLIRFFQSYCSNNDIVYIKFNIIDDKLVKFFTLPLSYVDKSKGIMEIDLKITPSNFIWNNIFSKNRRYKIKRFERDGFQAQEARTKSDLRNFYNLYYENMKYISANPNPYTFIENMWKILYPNHLRIWLVGKNKMIGGILIFKYGIKTYWIYAGINREKKYTRYSVLPYLLWKEIQKAEEEGYRYISLGGTPSNPNHPYYIEKMKFGSLFKQQNIVWIPSIFTGHLLLETRDKTISAWKAIRKILPNNFKRIIENKLSKF